MTNPTVNNADRDDVVITMGARTLAVRLWEARKAERERITAIIEDAKRGLTFGDDRRLVDNMLALIKNGSQ